MHLKKKIHFILYVVSRETGKILFGNVAGLNHNLSGVITNMRLKKNTSFRKSSNTELLVRQFSENGFTQVENLYEPELIKEISKKFARYVEDKNYSYVLGNDGEDVYSRAIFNGFQTIPETKLLINDKVKNLLEAYYKNHFQVNHLLMYRIYHVPESVLKRKEVYANRWHCDEDNTTFVKLFVYLTDVTEKDGPFHIHTKESTKQIIKMGFGNRDNYNVPITVLEEKDVIKPTGNRGTVFMCNCELGLHRAGIPVEGHYRDVIMMQFRPSQKPMQNEYIENFEEPTEINRK